MSVGGSEADGSVPTPPTPTTSGPSPVEPRGTSTASSATSTAARQATLREHNLALLTRELFASPTPLSRADLAGRSGMTRSTVSRLVEDLLAAGIVVERRPSSGARGRPAVPLAPARSTLVGLGLEVDVDHLAVRVLDLTGSVVVERLVPGDHRSSDPADVLGRMGDLGRDAAAAAAAHGARVVGSVLALPGLVDRRHHRLLLAPNLGWTELDPRPLLGPAEAFGDTVEVANEADVAALAAATPAPGRGGDDPAFLYLSGRIGIGAAAVVGGNVQAGPRGWAGEIGHVAVEPDGPRCRCGAHGCLEQYAGTEALLAAAGLPVSAGVTGLLAALAGDGDHADGERAERVRAALDRAAWALGVVLAGAVNLLDIDDVVLGGDLDPLAPALTPGIEAELHARVLAAPWSTLRVRPARLGRAPAATGAAIQALTAVVEQPLRYVPSAQSRGTGPSRRLAQAAWTDSSSDGWNSPASTSR